ncbi:MAG: alpha/beta fold hydrolase [Candidatus Promineifilaceae bacterium]|nr:alpha/beta fold hydrolase [Candidatus Promineifilaceae bacterium]
MKRKLRGFKRSTFELDFDLYRTWVPIPGVAGDKLSVIDIHPERVTQAIVFIHGYAGCAETWEHQINHFSKRYRVVAPDLRGHGQSDAPYTRYTMPELVSDIYAISQQLQLPERFILVGHSFGGSICTEYANAHPEQLSHLVLIATAGEFPLPKVVSLLYRLPAAFFRPWWKYRPRWNAAVHVMKRMMTNNLSRWVGWSKLASIETPTLVITGERDNYFPRRVYDDVGQTVPDAEVVDIAVSKHKVQLERYQAVNRAIERFVDIDKRHSTWRASLSETGLAARRPWLETYAAGTPDTVPIPRRPLHDFLESAADWVPKRTATRFYGAKLNYSQLNRLANQLAHIFHGLGVKPGDRVLIVLPNVPEFIVAFYGTLKIGGVAVLANPDADVDQAIAEAQQTNARVLVTLSGFTELAERARRESDVREVILVDLSGAAPWDIYSRLGARWPIASSYNPQWAEAPQPGLLLDDLLLDAPPGPPASTVSSTDLAAILFTSGTTGQPKGVCHTHASLVANTIQIRHWLPEVRFGKETILAIVPFIHAYGMTTAMNLSIALGATQVLLPAFDIQYLLDSVRRYKPTIFPGVPSIFAAINRHPDARNYGLSSIRACISGSAPLPVEVQEAFMKLTQGLLVEGYGLTESGPVTHINPLDGHHKTGSIGVPIPNTDAQIRDLASGVEMPPGQVGAMWVKGPQVMQGYWQNTVDTGTILRDGWLDTGDVAIMDTDGYFHVIGRTRDVIRAGEYTIYPRDVEELLYENHKVHEVAVVGVPPSAPEQKVKAFVVPRPGVDISKEELLELCRRRLEEYAVPWEIEFREALPRSFTGKIIRRLLVD